MSAFVFNLFYVTAATAQERKGTITGHVLDASRAVLPGARVELSPTGQTTASNGQGEFTLSGVAPGHYTLTISAVGFAPFSSKDVTVNAGGVANVEAVLQVEGKTEVVEVRAERQHGEVEALNRERTADNILQVLPSEVITSLPNTNIADAVGRLPSVSLERDEGEGKYVQIRGTEPRLSNVTVDGVHLASPENVRNVKLDAIPADLVDAVELSKTLSANQEADAIGGSVNLVTKSASNRPYISLQGMGGYTPIAGGRSLYQTSATLGQRFFEKKLGIMVGGSWDWNGRGIDDVEPSVGVNSLNGGGTFAGTNGYDQREYWYDRTRFGFGGTMDYKLGDWSTAYIRGLFSQFKDDGQDWIYSPTVGTFATPTLTNFDGTTSFTHVTRKPAQRLFSTSAGAHHTFGQTLLNYEIAFGQARFTGFFPRANFSPISTSILNGGVQYALNDTNPFTPVLTAKNANIFDPTQYQLAGLDRGDDHTFERDVTGTISLARNYHAGSHFSTFEVGAKVRDSHKSELDVRQNFSATDNDPTVGLMSTMLGSFTNPNYYFGVYPHYGPTTDYSKIIAFYNANLNNIAIFNPYDAAAQEADLQRTAPGDFNVDERVIAGYAMNTINFSRFRLQAGVRFEATQASYLANHTGVDAMGNFLPITQVTGSQDYVDVLPSVQLQTRLSDDTIIRVGYGLGIARPNFSDLPPHINEDRSNPAKPTVDVGNPNLKRTHAQNVDLLFEHYLKPIGVISGGFFYKYLTDPIYSTRTLLTSGTFANFLQSQPVNGSSANITGLELAWQQRLSFLPGALNGMGVRANYSWTTSDSSFPVGAFGNRTDHPALQRQAPNNWNFDTTYDKRGFSARMGLTHNDANIFQYNFQQGSDGGIKGPNGDVYLYPHTQVDVQASYWIPRSHGFQVIGYVLNLTNETFGFYQGSEQFDIQREYYNRTFAVGLRWSPSREPTK
jgi:TonB-dependent receptor